MVSGYYPMRGLVFPLDVLRNTNSLARGSANTVFVSFRASYDRAYESLEASDKFIDLLVDQLGQPAPEGEEAVMEELHAICEEWAGKESA